VPSAVIISVLIAMKYQFAVARTSFAPPTSYSAPPTIAAASVVMPASSGSTVPMNRFALYPPLTPANAAASPTNG
jgi:hypothetical protein